MTLEPSDPSSLAAILQVERLYAGLIRNAGQQSDGEPTLGGQLLYAGELDAEARALTIAANIAGAATLAATADAGLQKQAIRDGVVDFLVTSLDEAIRILKNEIRKRETVAVCVGASPEAVEQEMAERGLLPDLVFPTPRGGSHDTKSQPRPVRPAPLDEHLALLTWRVDRSPALWLPRLDALALEHIGPGNGAARRWLRLAPRFLGRLSRNVRVLSCDPKAAQELVERFQTSVLRGEIGAEVEISLTIGHQTAQQALSLPRNPACSKLSFSPADCQWPQSGPRVP